MKSHVCAADAARSKRRDYTHGRAVDTASNLGKCRYHCQRVSCQRVWSESLVRECLVRECLVRECLVREFGQRVLSESLVRECLVRECLVRESCQRVSCQRVSCQRVWSEIVLSESLVRECLVRECLVRGWHRYAMKRPPIRNWCRTRPTHSRSNVWTKCVPPGSSISAGTPRRGTARPDVSLR